ncbi:MAG: class I adenylate-forming enzyme family protein [Anaerolineae bacterium]|nr:class I adenylate-forming enzyme family protein [Anaerolineae bacterium]
MIVRALLGRLGPQHLIPLARRLGADSEFVVCEGRRLTRRQLFGQVEALAAGLASLGITSGHRVATLLPACPEAVYALFLPWVLGNVEVPLNPLLREHELRHILADCGARAVITTRSWAGHDYLRLLTRLRADLPQLRYIIVREPGTADEPNVLPLPGLLARTRARPRARISPGEAGRISYTSGTTGLPKGVVHARDGYWGLAHQSASARLDLSLLRCLLLPFPPYHYAGWLGVMSAFLSGGRVVLMEHFNPQRMLELIQEERVTQLGASPTMCRLLLNTPGQERYDLSSLRRVTLGAEPCPPDLVRALHERLGCHIENFYGMTECGIISWTGDGDPWQVVATTVGRPAPGSQVRIEGPGGQALPAGQIGEVVVRTTQMMLGYHQDPDLTSEVLDAEGWFHTGDVGYLGEDGYLRLVDRKKDVIIRAGENVYPAEVERYLCRHPAIARAAVVGVPSRLSGEALWAFVEPAPGALLTGREVLEHCRGGIAPYKVPQAVRVVERLPVTATGKVQKFKVREMALAEESVG